MFEDKTILVTGGTGSMGKVLVRRLLSGEQGLPKKVIVLSRDEAKQHDMRVSFLSKAAVTDEVIYDNFQRILEFRIGDVREYQDVVEAVRGCEVIINAAALKQVPTCEYFPHQAVLTNCLGAQNIVRAVNDGAANVETVVGISTDKACKPVNVMGMTKSLQERIFISANILCPETRFICVRYGNVLASRGSVIPLFHQQIINGGPITVTSTEMTRFLLSINQAVDTVFAAVSSAKAGEIFVPNAPASRVIDIANALNGEREIEISIVGVRPGEKMHEIMVSEEECLRVEKRGSYYAIMPMLPELQDSGFTKSALDSEFSSADNVLSYEQTVQLLTDNDLMLEQQPSFGSLSQELLR